VRLLTESDAAVRQHRALFKKRSDPMALPHFILLYVDAPQTSAAFYAGLLDRQPLESSPNFVLFELSPDLRLGLWARRGVEPTPLGAGDTGELAMAVGTNEEVEVRCADQRRKGVTILQEPVTMDFGRTFLTADPDGHRLRVFCPAP
jgi:catechol 2,3-dioxygenase-like lactoylglutathione lyase family enzyme